MGFCFRFFRFLAFKLDAELAHRLTLWVCSFFPKTIAWIFYRKQRKIDPKYSLDIGGIPWAFPVGLAAGLDKNARATDFFSSLLFGALEVGTVTPRPQGGNPRPRLYRYPKIESLRNHMGFNSEGMEIVANNIARGRRTKIIGVNLGKNRNTLANEAFKDYQKLYKHFAPLADYLVINVSSPNTPGLRALESQEALEYLFDSLEDLRKERPCPLFIKISPGLGSDILEVIVSVATKYHLTGIVATNTAVMEKFGKGGMSGTILKELAQETRERVLKLTKGTNLEVIGVGGISSFDDLLAFWKAGGKVVQIYTSFIFRGPQLLEEIREGINRKMEEEGVSSLTQLIEKIHSHGL